jgi:hypothetical protein
MADVTGVKIVDLTAAGSSDDGAHVWITHRLGDGSEYPLVYPYEAIGYLIMVLTDAARSALQEALGSKSRGGGRGIEHQRHSRRGDQGRHLTGGIRSDSAPNDG